jgi:hypothetical protein
MLVELGYQLYIHACSGNYLRNIFLLFFLSFLDFLCEASKRCYGLSRRPGGDFGCLDDKVDSSGRPFFLS